MRQIALFATSGLRGLEEQVNAFLEHLDEAAREQAVISVCAASSEHRVGGMVTTVVVLVDYDKQEDA